MCANFYGLNQVNGFGVKSLYSTQRIGQNPYINFGQNGLERDKFEYSTNSINQYTTESSLAQAIRTNPRIREILRQNGMRAELNMQNLRDILTHHATDTQTIAKGMYEHLPQAMKNTVDKKVLSDACYLHDVGKVLIPDEILNKPDRLNAEEERIMHTHSELSYELLKNSNINQQTLNLIKYHHQNPQKTGYPVADSSFEANVAQQIISTADKYSALTERRAYKEPMSEEKALGILYKDVREGKLNPMVFKSLVAYVKENAMLSDKIAV